MRLITSSLRNQLVAAFALVTVVFAIDAILAVTSLNTVSSTLNAGSARLTIAEELSVATYNMQGSQLMNTLTNGAVINPTADVQLFRARLAELGHVLQTQADRDAYARIQRSFASWAALNSGGP